MYRAGLEGILGSHAPRGDVRGIDPCIPTSWPGYSIAWRFGASRYEIQVETRTAAAGALPRPFSTAPRSTQAAIPLRDDGGRHVLKVVLGEKR